jgi:hypothetical protein
METGQNYVPSTWRLGKTMYPVHGDWAKLYGMTHCYDLISFHRIKLDYLYVLTTDQIVINASKSPRLYHSTIILLLIVYSLTRSLSLHLA